MNNQRSMLSVEPFLSFFVFWFFVNSYCSLCNGSSIWLHFLVVIGFNKPNLVWQIWSQTHCSQCQLLTDLVRKLRLWFLINTAPCIILSKQNLPLRNSFLTPLVPILERREKINLDFYFHTFFFVVRRDG